MISFDYVWFHNHRLEQPTNFRNRQAAYRRSLGVFRDSPFSRGGTLPRLGRRIHELRIGRIGVEVREFRHSWLDAFATRSLNGLAVPAAADEAPGKRSRLYESLACAR